MKSRIINCFNKNADTYDLVGSVQARVARALAERLPSHPYQRLLEIGCGTGFLSQHLLSKFPTTKMVLTDIAPRMIEIIKNKFSHENVSFICEDGEEMVTTYPYDLIVSSMTLQWFINHAKSLKNIYSNLSSGGHFYFAMLGENSFKEWHEITQLKNLSLPRPRFIPLTEITTIFHNIHLEKETIVQPYDSLSHFLFSLKKLGAAAAENYIPSAVGNMRKLLREFNSPIEISYEIIYGQYVKP